MYCIMYVLHNVCNVHVYKQIFSAYWWPVESPESLLLAAHDGLGHSLLLPEHPIEKGR